MAVHLRPCAYLFPGTCTISPQRATPMSHLRRGCATRRPTASFWPATSAIRCASSAAGWSSLPTFPARACCSPATMISTAASRTAARSGSTPCLNKPGRRASPGWRERRSASAASASAARWGGMTTRRGRRICPLTPPTIAASNRSSTTTPTISTGRGATLPWRAIFSAALPAAWLRWSRTPRSARSSWRRTCRSSPLRCPTTRRANGTASSGRFWAISHWAISSAARPK